ncbi:MAG TPA: cysteine hydrolase [Candidatus Acidoferrum sp.]|nr:cysteine hydrolase [Candidatus Acidoferrum sp.]
MALSNTVFWEVDVQVDFMLRGGRLYVPGAESIVGNVSRLVDAARKGRVFLISSADAHNADDPELREWPPHCLKDSPGAALLPEACASPRLIIPNQRDFSIPQEFGDVRQITLEKNTLDVFDNPNTDALLAQGNRTGTPFAASDSEFIVFGVATEYCVRCTANGLLQRGYKVALVLDAIHAIEPEEGEQVIGDLRLKGAQLISTQAALALV